MRRTPRSQVLLARLRRASTAPLPLLGLLAAIGPLTLTGGSEPVQHPAEVAYQALPPLPEGSTDRSAAGLEQTAIALAATLHAVPISAHGAECAIGDLRVSWDEPGDRYSLGAHVTPIGPEPDATTVSVNGIVACRGSDYSYMGFEARWVDGRWDVVDVPFVGAEEDEHALVAQPAPAIPQGPKPVPVLAAPGTISGPIEGYAAYEPQRTCDPTPKVGTRALAGALLRDYPGSRNLGIVRSCALGGRSEHKEGRAFDWGVNIGNPNEKAAADAFIGALMATDAAGNRHAIARRMGVMYLIWDRQVWSAYRASEGWRPYSGSSPHRDHVHLSLSWAGANGRTSFWSGTVPPDLPTASPVTANLSSSRSVDTRSTGPSTAGTTAGHGHQERRGAVELVKESSSGHRNGRGRSRPEPADDGHDAVAPRESTSDDGDPRAEREARRVAERVAERERLAEQRREAEQTEAERRAAEEAERQATWRAERDRLAREEAQQQPRRQRRAERRSTAPVAPAATEQPAPEPVAPAPTDDGGSRGRGRGSGRRGG